MSGSERSRLQGWTGTVSPRRQSPDPWPRGLGKDRCPRSSSLQRVKDSAARWPLRYHQDFELSPAAQGKHCGGAKQRSQWKGRVSQARGQILLVKATQPRSSPVPPAPTAGLKEQCEPMGCRPVATDGHLSQGHGQGAAVGPGGREEMPSAFATNCLFFTINDPFRFGAYQADLCSLVCLEKGPTLP